ncbi:MAG: hypothetical protein ACLVJ6_14815 [Merdibacter sp.]
MLLEEIGRMESGSIWRLIELFGEYMSCAGALTRGTVLGMQIDQRSGRCAFARLDELTPYALSELGRRLAAAFSKRCCGHRYDGGMLSSEHLPN